MKTAFVFEKVNQHEDQRAVFGRIASHFEVQKRGEIDQSQALGIACTTSHFPIHFCIFVTFSFFAHGLCLEVAIFKILYFFQAYRSNPDSASHCDSRVRTNEKLILFWVVGHNMRFRRRESSRVHFYLIQITLS